MRSSNFSKKALFAAAVAIASCGATAIASDYNGSTNFGNYGDGTILISTMNPHLAGNMNLGRFTGAGTVIFEGDTGSFSTLGGGQALYQAVHDGANPPYTQCAAYVNAAGMNVTEWNDLPTGLMMSTWTGGELVLRSSARVVVAGFINSWIDLGALNADLVAAGRGGYAAGGNMSGVSQITINDSSTLVLGNRDGSRLGAMVPAGRDMFVALHNLRAGTAGDQINSRLDVGGDSLIHINLYVDNLAVGGGSIGIIEGAASIYKTGVGKFTLLNDNNLFSGDVVAAGGSLIMQGAAATVSSGYDSSTQSLARAGYGSTAFGHVLANASSINISGTMASTNADGSKETEAARSEGSRQGFEVRARKISTTTDSANYPVMNGTTATVTQYKESAFTSPAAGNLVISQNQIIRNFQAMFAAGAAATDQYRSAASAILNAADNVSVNTPIIAGTGKGSYLGVGVGDVLAINQDAGHGGIYKGTICGVNAAGDEANASTLGGTIVKYGAGDLALILEGANYSKLVVAEGKLVGNIEALNLSPGKYDWATGTWTEEAGVKVLSTLGTSHPSLVLIENNANTIKTRLQVETGAELRFSTYDYVDTLGGSVDAGYFRTPGTIEIKLEQRFVTGDVVLSGGIELRLSSNGLAKDSLGVDLDNNVDADGKPLEYSGGTFGLANSIVLFGNLGPEDINLLSTISLNDTNQKLNNLAGDTWSQIRLGLGTMTANIKSNDQVALSEGGAETLYYGTFNGLVSGLGNIYKTGAGTLTLGGGTTVAHYGSTVISQGNFATTVADTLNWSSALILNAGISATLGGNTEAVNAVYGLGGSSITHAGTLTIGSTSSRVNVLTRAAELAGYDGYIVTDMLGTSNTVAFPDLTISLEKRSTFLKPIADFIGKKTALDNNVVEAARVTHDVLTQEQYDVLDAYFAGTFMGAGQWATLSNLLGRTVSATDPITQTDITRLYLTLVSKANMQAGVDTSGDLLDRTVTDRLSFDGAMVATKQLVKIGDDRLTISGTLSTGSIKVEGGILEVDYDTLVAARSRAAEITVSGNVADGIEVSEGATFSVNTTGATGDVIFNEFIFGKGNFEKKGSGAMILGSDVLYSGETHVAAGSLEIVLRNATIKDKNGNNVFVQGDITVDSGATLELNQEDVENDVTWDGNIVGDGELIKIGDGTLNLTGNVSVSGNLDVSEGTLAVKDFVPAGDLNIDEGATFNAAITAGTTKTFSKNITGSGSFIKSGDGTLVLANPRTPATLDFSGIVNVSAGTLQLSSADIVSNAEYINVAAPAKLLVSTDQTLKGLKGAGQVLLGDGVKLSLETSAGSTIGFGNADGDYIVTPQEWSTSVNKLSGDIMLDAGATSADFVVKGTGATELAGTIGAGIGIAVESGQLIVSSAGVGTHTIQVASAGEVILSAADGESSTFGGLLNYTGVVGTDPRNFGKIGAGTVSISATQLTDLNLKVYEGTLAVTGEVWTFTDAKIAKGATLSVEVDNAPVVPLSSVEGSGTLELIANSGDSTITMSTTPMLKPIPENPGDPYFNGILKLSGNAGNRITFNADENGTILCSIDSDENSSVNFNGDDIVVMQEHDTVIRGDFSTQGFTLTGDGRLAITKQNITLSNAITVKDGNLQIDADTDSTADLKVEGSSKLYFAAVVGDVNQGKIANATIDREDDAPVSDLSLIKTGDKNLTLDFAPGGTQAALALGDDLWGALPAVTLGVEQGSLILSGLGNIDDKIVLLAQANSIKTVADSMSGGNVTSIAGATEFGTVAVDVAGGVEETLSKTISGAGNFQKLGGGDLIVSANQNYWGATTLSAGTTSFAQGVKLQTSGLVVENGATLSGGVELVGGTTVTKSTKQTIVDDATLTTTTITVSHVYRDGILVSENTSSTTATKRTGDVTTGPIAQADVTSHTGGDFTLNGTLVLNVDKGETVKYSGTFNDLGASALIELDGDGATSRGNELKLFEAIGSGQGSISSKLLGAFSSSSLPLMIVENTAGTVSAYVIQQSIANVPGADLRDGLAGTFTDALDKLCGSAAPGSITLASDLDMMGPIGVALNKTSTSELAAAIANLSPIGLASMVAMPVSGFTNDINHISNRTMQRRYDLPNVELVEGPEFFALAQANIVTNGDGSSAANYDYNTYGALAGMDFRFGEELTTLGGFAVSYDNGNAKIHDNGGKITMDDIRATLFASGLLGDGSFYFDAGVQGGFASYDTKRDTVTGRNKGDTDGWSAGAFFTVGKGIAISQSFHISPYIGVSYMHNSISAFKETGDSALDVDDFSADSLRGRLGIGMHIPFIMGDWDCRFSLDVAYAHDFLGEETSIDAAFADRRTGNDKFSVDAQTLSADMFSIGPSLNVNLSDKTTIFMGYTAEIGFNSDINQNLNIGFRRCF